MRERRLRGPWNAALGAAAAGVLLLGGCAAGTSGPRFQGDLAGLTRVRSPRLDEVWQRPGVRLGDYTRLILEPARLAPDLDTGRDRYREHDLEWLRQRLDAQLAATLGDDYLLVDESAPDVLRIQLTLTGVKANRPPRDILQRGGATQVLHSAAGVGWATMQVEFRDAASGQIVLAAADRYSGVEFDSNLAVNDTWSDARRAFDRWARALRLQLANS